MVTQELNIQTISNEALEVMGLIKQGRNFLISGGAGSGKTYTLVEIIVKVLETKPLLNIACITYTNAAVKEIKERVDHPHLHVSTIHEFLWENIKHFQTELKAIIIELINDEDQPRFKKTNEGSEDVKDTFFDSLEKGIQYKEFVKIINGIISHDELLIIAHEMYEKYPKLCSITKDTYPCIFIDEYQDTDKNVINILLQHFKQSKKECVIGFFGDAMQSIYDGSIGNLDEFKGKKANQVKEVKKEQNRRNPQLIIDLANCIRNDDLEQSPSKDINAPNMNSDGSVKKGSILFLHSTDDDLNEVREYLKWDFSNADRTKELNLTHNLIAGKAGFEDFMRIYGNDKILDFVKRIKKFIKKYPDSVNTENKTFGNVVKELQFGKSGSDLNAVSPTRGMKDYIEVHDATYKDALKYSYEEISAIYIDKDQMIDDKKNDIADEGKIGSKRDDLIKHLFKIQHNIRLYKENKINEFLQHTNFNISSIASKIKLKEHIENLINVDGKSIEDVINMANESGLAVIDDRLLGFKEKKQHVYSQVSKIKFSQFQNLYRYLEGFTPFSTQHKTKGAEFPNVLVILDNGNWNNYNFENLFTGLGLDTVLDRTQKIFYVCCTRTKENLAVFYHNPSSSVLDKAKEWFGKENVVKIGT